MEWVAGLMFLAACAVLLTGYPVAFALGGTALLFGLGGAAAGVFGYAELLALPSRLYGTMTNDTLVAVPLFVFMGVMLERSRIAEELLDSVAALFGPLRGGLGFTVILVGALLAAATGIVGATVVTMGLLSLPTMLKRGYDPALASGTICAAGTLGQVIPPSIVLVLLGDVLASAYQRAQHSMGVFAVETVSVGDLFAGALLPGLFLVLLYAGYLTVTAWRRPEAMPALEAGARAATRGGLGTLMRGLLAPLLLIGTVLGSIMAGVATPTEAAGLGAAGAMLLAAARGASSLATLRETARNTARITSMVFLILVGASLFSLVFSAYGGDDAVRGLLQDLPGGTVGAVLLVMVVMFLLGFILDFIEITFVVVPIVGPALLAMGLDPVWLGVMMAINLQTSFLTPPFGFALFYLRGVAPEEVSTGAIYRGAAPFVGLQLAALALLALWPGLATWLPGLLYP
ncbi:TRAP dicarboxylate transporter subunit DctM [Salinisphaera sp. PC39]|uniref:TRAP transporter large permease n=1 Tax=Salinisphaera sp. PC39 TaxID=1304156 RepID=UPI003340D814